MAVVRINIPEKLWERLQQIGRPVEEVVIETLEKAFNGGYTAEEEELPREKIMHILIDSGTVVDPSNWNDSYAQAWLSRPEDDRKKLIEEMDQEWHPGSVASQTVIEGRR